MAEVGAYQAPGEILRMIPVYAQSLQDSVGTVLQVKRLRQFPSEVFEDTGCHQR